MLDYALESLNNLRPGDCIVCFSKADIYSVSRQIEAQGLECAVIYGSLPPGKILTLFLLKRETPVCSCSYEKHLLKRLKIFPSVYLDAELELVTS